MSIAPPDVFIVEWEEALRAGRCVVVERRDKKGRVVRRDRISPRREQKRQLMRAHGITTGRQWRKLKKRLRREAAHG